MAFVQYILLQFNKINVIFENSHNINNHKTLFKKSSSPPFYDLFFFKSYSTVITYQLSLTVISIHFDCDQSLVTFQLLGY
jgi:hypothetical protein